MNNLFKQNKVKNKKKAYHKNIFHAYIIFDMFDYARVKQLLKCSENALKHLITWNVNS